ncbi:hypothetical protein TgHK011_000452 [Trichoderma gracile]|nr:hypothetical protein TgHK011_000452 [Trichoderma gracile]
MPPVEVRHSQATARDRHQSSAPKHPYHPILGADLDHPSVCHLYYYYLLLCDYTPLPSRLARAAHKAQHSDRRSRIRIRIEIQPPTARLILSAGPQSNHGLASIVTRVSPAVPPALLASASCATASRQPAASATPLCSR